MTNWIHSTDPLMCSAAKWTRCLKKQQINASGVSHRVGSDWKVTQVWTQNTKQMFPGDKFVAFDFQYDFWLKTKLFWNNIRGNKNNKNTCVFVVFVAANIISEQFRFQPEVILKIEGHKFVTREHLFRVLGSNLSHFSIWTHSMGNARSIYLLFFQASRSLCSWTHQWVCGMNSIRHC